MYIHIYILPYVSPHSYTSKHLSTKYICIDRGAFLVLVYECGIILHIISCLLLVIVLISTCNAQEESFAQGVMVLIFCRTSACVLIIASVHFPLTSFELLFLCWCYLDFIILQIAYLYLWLICYWVFSLSIIQGVQYIIQVPLVRVSG